MTKQLFGLATLPLRVAVKVGSSVLRRSGDEPSREAWYEEPSDGQASAATPAEDRVSTRPRADATAPERQQEPTDAERRAEQAARRARSRTPAAPPRQEPRTETEAEVVAESADLGAEDEPGPEVRVAEPWDDYSRAPVSEIAARLPSESDEVVAAVRLYEESHRRRKGVLEAVERERKRR